MNKNPKSKYCQIQNKSKIPNPKLWSLEIGVYLVILVVLGFGICCFAYAEEKYVYDSRGRRDPFVPLVGVGLKKIMESLQDITSIEDVRFQGTALDTGGKKVAILNGEIVSEGETVGHLMVEKIFGNEVTLVIDGEEYKLNIYEPERGI